MEKLELVVEYLHLEFSGKIGPRDRNLRITYVQKAFKAMKLDDVTKGVVVNKKNKDQWSSRQFQGQESGKDQQRRLRRSSKSGEETQGYRGMLEAKRRKCFQEEELNNHVRYLGWKLIYLHVLLTAEQRQRKITLSLKSDPEPGQIISAIMELA